VLQIVHTDSYDMTLQLCESHYSTVNRLFFRNHNVLALASTSQQLVHYIVLICETYI